MQMQNTRAVSKPKPVDLVNLTPVEIRFIKRLRQLRRQRPQGVVIVVEADEVGVGWCVGGRREG